jgi:hypothetical protein
MDDPSVHRTALVVSSETTQRQGGMALATVQTCSSHIIEHNDSRITRGAAIASSAAFADDAGVMKLKPDMTPDLVAAMAAKVTAGERAVTAALREAGSGDAGCACASSIGGEVPAFWWRRGG